MTVQAGHALIEATRSFIDGEAIHPHLIICRVKDEATLAKEAERLSREKIDYKIFYEDDLDGAATALATRVVYEDERKVMRRYRLL